MLVVRGLIGGLFQLAVLAALILIPAGTFTVLLPFAILVARIEVEERTLKETLSGYTDYTNRVRHRLVPFVW